MPVTNRVLASRFMNPQRLGFICVVGVLALVVDVTAFEIFGVETLVEAAEQFVIIVVGGYLGLTLADVSWERKFGT
ncbi:hypothetical protein [Haladaptatus sp. CMSO5]|uniref:hypothetical protein n=1 Tax=Haladaptatus sp. CMSO5 TaxID=3120514 RepID=UPI002FCE2AB8